MNRREEMPKCTRFPFITNLKKLISVYERIHTVITITGEEMLTHHFPTDCNYQLISDNGNYSIDSSVIGTFEVTKVCY